MNEGTKGEVTSGGDQWAKDRLAAVGHIASLIGHDVRNRLATLRGALELLEAGREASMPQEYRAILLREFDSFVEDFNIGVDMIRCQASSPEPVSVSEFTKEIVDSFRPNAARAKVKIDLQCAHSTDRAQLDKRLLRVTLLNLLRNAKEALEEKEDGRIQVRTSSDASFITFTVEDNGPGVPPKEREKLFAKPDAADEDSSGLGLSLCRDAMVLMDGKIRLASAPSETGARFEVIVPFARRSRPGS